MTNQREKHLAIFIHSLSGGGAQQRTLTLVNAFAERQHRVDLVVVSPEGPLLRELSPLVRLVRLNSPWPRLFRSMNRKRRKLEVALSIRALVRYLRREQPDVLLSASNHANLGALWARRLAHVPVPLVIRVNNHLSGSAMNPKRRPRRFSLWTTRQVYRWADHIISVSKGVAQDVAKQTGITKNRITTIYNPTFTPNLQEKCRARPDHPWVVPDSPPLILGTGRLVTQKDFPTMVKAFARVRAVRPAHLVILGEGKERRQVLSLAQKLGVDADIALPGYADNPLAWMARASVFVLSSVWEGLPGVIIEALACGCPVVSTDCPSGPAEILADGVYGPLVPVGDDEALADAILSTLDAPPDPERLHARAAEFSSERAVDGYLEVLLAVASLHGIK